MLLCSPLVPRATLCKVIGMPEGVVGLLGPCHVQAALNGVGLQVPVTAFYSLVWLLQLGGLHFWPPVIAPWPVKDRSGSQR